MRTIDAEAPDSGAKLAVMYKMGALPDLFRTREKTIEALDNYPILISSVGEEYLKDRESILTYVKANLRYMEKYFSLNQMCRDCAEEEYDRLSKEMKAIKRNANITESVKFWFEYHSYDDEIISLLLNGYMWQCVHYTDKTYDEKRIIKALGKHSDLIYAVFDYWSEKFSVDRKASTSAKERYNTSDDENCSYLALRKCMELASKLDNQKEIYIRLFSYAFSDGYQARYLITDAALSQAFRSLTPEMRYGIANDFYYALQYLRASEVDNNLTKRVIHDCPIAANLLPDEQVLKNDLKVKICDFESECAKCSNCFFKHIILS